MNDSLEFIILLPEEKSALRTSLIIERRETIDITDPDILHRGQGNHHDLVIYKEATRPRPPTDEDEKRNPPGHICQFDVTLLDQQSKEIAEERRRLSFWFHSRKESFEHQEEFLHSLFQGKTFPRGKTERSRARERERETEICSRLFLIYQTSNGIITSISSDQEDSFGD